MTASVHIRAVRLRIAAWYTIAAAPWLIFIVAFPSDASDIARLQLGPVSTTIVLTTCAAMTFACGYALAHWLYIGIAGRGHGRAIVRGLGMTALSTVVSVIAAVPLAYLLSTDSAGIGLVQSITILPLLALAGLVVGLGMTAFTLPYGLLVTLLLRLVLWKPNDDAPSRIDRRLWGKA